MLERRITYRRNSSYRTRGNNFRAVKTPGTFVCSIDPFFSFRWQVEVASPQEAHQRHRHAGSEGPKTQRFQKTDLVPETVSRPYGGIHTGSEVRDRIMRA